MGCIANRAFIFCEFIMKKSKYMLVTLMLTSCEGISIPKSSYHPGYEAVYISDVTWECEEYEEMAEVGYPGASVTISAVQCDVDHLVCWVETSMGEIKNDCHADPDEGDCKWRGAAYAHGQTCDDIYDVIAFYRVEKE